MRLALLAFGLLLGGPVGTDPPSSLAPSPEPALLKVVFRRQLVRACAPKPVDGGTTCAPQSDRAKGNIVVSLVPVPEASLRGRDDPRLPLTLHLHATDSADASGDAEPTELKLGPGRWSLNWRGHPHPPAINARASAKLLLELEVIDGRCEKTASGCKLVATATELHASVSDRQ